MEAENRGDSSNFSSSNNSGKILGGSIVVTVGVVLLANKMGADIPYWIISWPMLLIVIGLYILVRHSFRNLTGLIPIFIGMVFLADRIIPDLTIRPYLWPMAIIAVGLFIIFNPGKMGRGRSGSRRWQDNAGISGSSDSGSKATSGEEYLDSVSIFGGVEKNIVTKDFRGGEITTLFGGSSINLSQADIKDTAVLELTQIFGGATLVIPANWRLQSEMVSVFGGIEDKRVFQKEQMSEPAKTLVLKGTSVFGGLEIKSF